MNIIKYEYGKYPLHLRTPYLFLKKKLKYIVIYFVGNKNISISSLFLKNIFTCKKNPKLSSDVLMRFFQAYIFHLPFFIYHLLSIQCECEWQKFLLESKLGFRLPIANYSEIWFYSIHHNSLWSVESSYLQDRRNKVLPWQRWILYVSRFRRR